TRTRAELRDGSWIVNGAKIFITNAGTDISACVTITVRTGEDEISNVIVPNGTPGYEISEPMHKLGWHASDTRELSFKDCAVPEGNLLGERGRGFPQFMEILDGGRISVAAMGVGLAQGAYDLAFALVALYDPLDLSRAACRCDCHRDLALLAMASCLARGQAVCPSQELSVSATAK